MNNIIIVKSNQYKANIMLQQIENRQWKRIFETTGFIGKNGVGKTTEGDNKTPIGVYDLGIAFGIHPTIETQLPYMQIQDNMYWIDDPDSKFYNELVKIEKSKDKYSKFYKSIIEAEIDWKSAEHLIEYKNQYEYAIHIKYNEEKNKGKGSAIFLHCSLKRPTAGCIAIPKKDIEEILKKVNSKTKIYIL